MNRVRCSAVDGTVSLIMLLVSSMEGLQVLTNTLYNFVIQIDYEFEGLAMITDLTLK